MIDMDEVCVGDPLSDIGGFIGNCHLNGMISGCGESRILEIVEALRGAYAARVAWEVPQRRLNWYIAASILSEVTRRSVRQWKGLGMASMRQCLDLSAQYCLG